MGVLSEVTRPLWLESLNGVAKRPAKALTAWICDENFTLTAAVPPPVLPATLPSGAELLAFSQDLLLESIAFECGRFAAAAIESYSGNSGHKAFPKSYAWLLIKDYYAAYFAAHSLMLFFGRGVVQLQSEQTRSIDRVHNISFGTNAGLGQAQYNIQCNPRPLRLMLTLITGNSGSHGKFWESFGAFLQWLAHEVLGLHGKTVDQQAVSAKLDDLRAILQAEGAKNYSWLSRMRNEVNYKQAFAVWHPYKGQPPGFSKLTAPVSHWDMDPLAVSLTIGGGRERVLIFHSACQFILSACIDVSREMAFRCPVGQSFLNYSILDIIDRTNLCQSAP